MCHASNTFNEIEPRRHGKQQKKFKKQKEVQKGNPANKK